MTKWALDFFSTVPILPIKSPESWQIMQNGFQPYQDVVLVNFDVCGLDADEERWNLVFGIGVVKTWQLVLHQLVGDRCARPQAAQWWLIKQKPKMRTMSASSYFIMAVYLKIFHFSHRTSAGSRGGRESEGPIVLLWWDNRWKLKRFAHSFKRERIGHHF